jgi:hypothetical protein
VVGLLNDRLHSGIKEMPCHNSPGNRIEKSGLYTCSHLELKESGVACGEITDESMQTGSRKILLSPGMRAGRENEVPLGMSDVEIPDISVEKNWNGALIRDRLKAVTEKTGRAPAYVRGDNASIMNRGIRESSPVHLRDAGHTPAMFLERQYREAPDFYPR